MSKHEHIYGVDRTMFLYLDGSAWNKDDYFCIECGHRPNHTTRKKLRNNDKLPMDIKRFVIMEHTDVGKYRGHYTDSAKFALIQQRRLAKKEK